MNCGACGKTGLRSTTLAIVISDKGAPERKRVCAGCARHGVYVVPMSRPVVKDDEKAERKSQKEVLAPFIKRIEALAKIAEKTIDQMPPASHSRESWRAKTEAYEAVVHMLKEGRA